MPKARTIRPRRRCPIRFRPNELVVVGGFWAFTVARRLRTFSLRDNPKLPVELIRSPRPPKPGCAAIYMHTQSITKPDPWWELLANAVLVIDARTETDLHIVDVEGNERTAMLPKLPFNFTEVLSDLTLGG